VFSVPQPDTYASEKIFMAPTNTVFVLFIIMLSYVLYILFIRTIILCDAIIINYTYKTRFEVYLKEHLLEYLQEFPKSLANY
jgi:hypothetical protein